jgi:hypothetical protein
MPKENFNMKRELDNQEKSDNVFKMKDILVISEAVSRILNKNLPVLARTKLIRIHKLLKSEIEIYNEVRIKKADEYSGGKERIDKIVDEKGVERKISNFDIPDDKQTEFNKEIKKLQDQEIEIKFTKIPLSDFDDCEENIGQLLSIIDDLLVI